MERYVRTNVKAEEWGVTRRSINGWCKDGLIPGAYKEANRWMIPECANRPEFEKTGNWENITTGIQDFISLRQQNGFYVDKSDFISKWWESGDAVTLITRPRRFGKTLNLSMLEAFFSNTKNADEYFEGLKISSWERYEESCGQYPVIFLSFAGIKSDNYRECKLQLIELLLQEYEKFVGILGDKIFLDTYHRFEECVASGNAEETIDVDIAMSLHRLSNCLYKHYSKRVIILLDEYDTPMQEAYLQNYWDDITSLFRNFFNNTLKTNPAMERGMITGITRISKESIFSDLNNLMVVTTATPMYEDCFGFLEAELNEILRNRGLLKELPSIREWYDGFSFGNVKNIYNPWSIQHYLKMREYGCYWANTSSNEMVSLLLRQASSEVKRQLEDLLDGRTIECMLDEQISFDQLGKRTDALWSLLLASGYLKIVSRETTDIGNKVYKLALTNKEVLIMMRNLVREWFAEDSENYNGFIRAALARDEEYMNEYLSRYVVNSFSYFDVASNVSEENPEKFYHGFVLGLMIELENKYRIKSNRESGLGRYDIMLIPKNIADDAFIFEFKVKSSKEKNLDEALMRALQQIEDKQYDSELKDMGMDADKIVKIAVAFHGKSVKVKMKYKGVCDKYE